MLEMQHHHSCGRSRLPASAPEQHDDDLAQHQVSYIQWKTRDRAAGILIVPRCTLSTHAKREGHVPRDNMEVLTETAIWSAQHVIITLVHTIFSIPSPRR